MALWTVSPRPAWENLPFPEPRPEAQGGWRKRRSSFSPSRPFRPLVLMVSHRDGGGEVLGAVRKDHIPLSQSQFVQGGCGTFQRRLGGVCVAGQAWGGFRHRKNGTEVHSQRGHRGGSQTPMVVGHQNCVAHLIFLL